MDNQLTSVNFFYISPLKSLNLVSLVQDCMATGTLGQGAFICGTPITVQHQKQALELLFFKETLWWTYNQEIIYKILITFLYL